MVGGVGQPSQRGRMTLRPSSLPPPTKKLRGGHRPCVGRAPVPAPEGASPSARRPPSNHPEALTVTIREQPTTSERGYGWEHQKLRARWRRDADAGRAVCARCGGYIAPKGDACPRCGKTSCRWDLGHVDQDRTAYQGVEHACCNRATAAHRKARRGTRRQRPDWWAA